MTDTFTPAITHTDTLELGDGTVLTPGATFRVKGDGRRYRFIRAGWHKSKPRSVWIDAVQAADQPCGGIRSFRPRNIFNVHTAPR